MSVSGSSLKLVRAVRNGSRCQTDSRLHLTRCFSSACIRHATPTLHPTTRRNQQAQSGSTTALPGLVTGQSKPDYESMTPAERAARASARARARLQENQAKYTAARRLGGLADNSLFYDEDTLPSGEVGGTETGQRQSGETRNLDLMSFALNPKPNARARWQRKMLIRHVVRRGRLSKEVQIARTERSHLARSHFFKTSVKKLAPLARQIAGKSVDEAILQMRFSKKKAAEDIRAHLIQARDEAVVVKGMGLASIDPSTTSKESYVAEDPGITPPHAHQNPTKSIKEGFRKSPTDMYVAQAWVNRGPYGQEPEYRARGRVNILRPPWTGISVLLKEEKTRTRERADKEAKAIRKRTSKSRWTQLPDRPITRQSQYVLW